MNAEENRGVAILWLNDSHKGYEVGLEIHNPAVPGVYSLTNVVASE